MVSLDLGFESLYSIFSVFGPSCVGWESVTVLAYKLAFECHHSDVSGKLRI